MDGGEEVEFREDAGERREEEMKSLEESVIVADSWWGPRSPLARSGEMS